MGEIDGVLQRETNGVHDDQVAALDLTHDVGFGDECEGEPLAGGFLQAVVSREFHHDVDLDALVRGPFAESALGCPGGGEECERIGCELLRRGPAFAGEGMARCRNDVQAGDRERLGGQPVRDKGVGGEGEVELAFQEPGRRFIGRERGHPELDVGGDALEFAHQVGDYLPGGAWGASDGHKGRTRLERRQLPQQISSVAFSRTGAPVSCTAGAAGSG